MDHTVSTHSNPQPTRSSLNQSPSSESIVRSYHHRLSPSAGLPAKLPGASADCAECRSSILEGRLLVCDGCELGFHVDCAQMQGRKVMADEWLCGDCARNAVASNRWRLGAIKNKRGGGRSKVFDKNVLPCSVEQGDKHPFQAASDLAHQSIKLGSGLLIQPRESHRIDSLADFDRCPSSKRVRSPSNICLLPHMRNKMYLESLREFICQSGGGVLQEGWTVELKDSKCKNSQDVLYRAPDGKMFESMSEVARFLGLNPNDNSVEFDSTPMASLQPKRRKTAKLAQTDGDLQSQDNVVGNVYKDQFSGINNVDIVDESVSCAKVIDAESEEISGSACREYNDGFPVQYEDFFVLCTGEIDQRPSYHSASEIWPIGYKSCWHDKITGSLFICDVLGGGNSGPVFRVRRSSCSLSSIPVGSTVVYKSNLGQLSGQHEGNILDTTCINEDYSVLMMLSELSPPTEHDISFCLKGCWQASPCDGNLSKVQSDTTTLQDEIGEFSVEQHSSSSAWRMVSEKLVDACQKVFAQTGSFRYFCKHYTEETGSSEWIIRNQELDKNVDPLAKFYGSPESADIPSIIQDHSVFLASSLSLSKWLDQDRFGLNMEFVQELLEQNLDASSCHEYVYLKDRKTFSSSLTIGNRFLLAKTKDKVDLTHDKPVDDSIKSYPTSNILKVSDHLMDGNFIPPGEPVSTRLPPQLLSNALQVREFLCRFHNVLELSDLVSFEELETELISPWLDCYRQEKFQGQSKVLSGISSHRTVGAESGPTVSDKDPQALLNRETIETEKEFQAKPESMSLDRCNGFTLTKIHSSLIRVLLAELQSKVAAIIDPEFDMGELKSKRGRKKDADTDCWISAIRTKVNILPLNELTWPELARRYILSVLSMGGRLETADITTLEIGKIYRCLQGDGGVLCGSPTGVARIEADTAFLAEAVNNIYGHLIREHDKISIDDVTSQENIQGIVNVEDNDLPEWAKVLEPVRKLPTNVGARIKRCIFEALDRSPPEWAKEVLEHSISKGVYKGNASGPTKKAVLSLLADLQNASLQQRPSKVHKKQRLVSISEIIMKRCRNVLRHVAAADNARIFCKLLGSEFMIFTGGDDIGLLGSPAMVSRPLDFRTIDLKLAAGAYGGSHEAFLEDVREFWANVRAAYKDQPDCIKLVETLSQDFDTLYDKEVLTQFQKLMKWRQSRCLSAESQNEIDQMCGSACEILKAPWDEGICKVCGVDRDDDNVLLCDKCDAEYHTYCLNPPLAKIPEGNWYCPSCVAGKCIIREAPDTMSNLLQGVKYKGEFTRAHLNFLAHLASDMEESEYWELGVHQRSFLLTFLCDEMLSSALVRQHIEECLDAFPELMQNLRSTWAELKTLKCKEESLEAQAARSSRVLGSDTEQGINKYFTRQYSSKLKIDNTNAACFTPDLAPSEDLQGVSASFATESAGVGASSPSTLNNSQSDSQDLTSVRTQIVQLNNLIASLESRYLKVSVRREFLGRDSSGRLYWALADTGTQPLPISSGNTEMQQSRQIFSASFAEDVSIVRTDAAGSLDALRTFGSSGTSSLCPYEIYDNNICPTWVAYNSDEEIKGLLDYLQDDNSSDRELKESILQWENLRTQGNQATLSQPPECKKSTSSNSISTLATSFLEGKYGPRVAPEISDRRFKRGKRIDQQKMCRCECLELIWPSRPHCSTCHRSFLNYMELDGHIGGKCSMALPASDKCESNEIPKVKGMMKSELGVGGHSASSVIRHQNDKLICPFDLEEICSRFVISESNKDLVNGIGLIGSNGIPAFVPSVSPYISDSTAMLLPHEEAVVVKDVKLCNNERLASLQDTRKVISQEHNNFRPISLQPAAQHKRGKVSMHCCAPLCDAWSGCIVPEPSLRPLRGKAGCFLQQLKINLLDMDAALPEEAIRPSKRKAEHRWAWRIFVKSAERIYELAQATVTLEDMIKSDYLRNTWWYWSSSTMAAKISTLSALALRIYSLDAAIYYNKTSCAETPQKKISTNKRKERDT